ncbi:GNAT family N-acetyltransferase [Acinetobacter sp. LoGeW2-3]|uniref:GNAT family N-acetyltransferase n=1 Tax=Acinetobacter sp. LoGeW2-3 TaxID=1808001 RepID=UPI000C057F0F|nr:GNAT family N-acetyltransferase [Acinetobacter sp. LoGeW2-3]ATO20801.1 GNAT family N-acetyltransferase [Acinetobacter sp. LoGeW2-3]
MSIQDQIQIEPLENIKQQEWLPLWRDYQTFYQTQLSEEINHHTWQRLVNPELEHIYGFAAILNQQVIGIVHVIEHDSCWTLTPYAYLQDLYTHVDFRGQGVARALIEKVYDYAKQKGCDRVYWLTHETNLQAQQLYDQVAKKTGFIQYRMT